MQHCDSCEDWRRTLSSYSLKRRRPKFLNLTKVGVRRRRRVEHSSIERESTQPFVAAFGPQVSPLLLLTRGCRPAEQRWKHVWPLIHLFPFCIFKLPASDPPLHFCKNQIQFLFNNSTVKVCISCSWWRCPGTSAPSAPHLTVSLILCSFKSNAQGESPFQLPFEGPGMKGSCWEERRRNMSLLMRKRPIYERLRGQLAFFG